MRKNKRFVEQHTPGGNFYQGKHLGISGADSAFSRRMQATFPVDYFDNDDDDEDEDIEDDILELRVMNSTGFSLIETLERLDSDDEDDDREDEDVDEQAMTGGVAGVGMKLGHNPDGSKTTKAEYDDLIRKQDIYRITENQFWSHSTLGKTKFK